MRRRTCNIAEFFLYLIITSVVIITGEMLTIGHVILVRSICYLIVLFYIIGYRSIFGEITPRQFVGLKFSSLVLFICTVSSYSTCIHELFWLYVVSSLIIVCCMLFECYKFCATHCVFYVKYIVRQLVVLAISSCSYFVPYLFIK